MDQTAPQAGSESPVAPEIEPSPEPALPPTSPLPAAYEPASEQASEPSPPSNDRKPTRDDILTGILGLVAALLLLFTCLVASGAGAFQGINAASTALLPSPTETPTETETPTPEPTLEPTLTPTITLTPTVTATFTPTPIIALQVTGAVQPQGAIGGPWLLVSAPNGLWAYGPDPTHPLQLSEDPLAGPKHLELAAAPRGGNLAYIVSGSGTPTSLTLIIQHLPDGKKLGSISLLPSMTTATPPPAVSPDVRRAILDTDSLAWSPDGSSLAFTGMIDGPGANLYLVSLDTGHLSRLTDSAQQDINPVWSPEGDTIIYEEAESIPEKGGPQVVSKNAVDAGNGAMNLLYQTQSNGERIIGWFDNQTFIVYSHFDSCGGSQLRTVRVPSGVFDTKFTGCISDALYEPLTRTLFFSAGPVQDRICACALTKQQPGLYLFPAGLGLPQKYSSDDLLELRPAPGFSSLLARTTDGWNLAYDPNGMRIKIPYVVTGMLPEVATASSMQAWSGPEGSSGLGLWIAIAGDTPHRIFSGSPTQPRWTPGGQTLFFFSGSDLYYANAPDYTPALLDSFPKGSLQSTWVKP